ncbi:MAG TPA: alpha/beta hydrolase [Thermoanaerobaculia bacterium]|nr:alpha/beta hydrolase [Thermoanaerobaculia bacterium]
MKEERIQGAGGSLFVRSWRPDAPARAVVLLVHGFNSHSGYYPWVAEQLRADGLAAYALDLRGRGNSEGERYYAEHVNDYLDDVDRLAKLARSREPGLPVYILGHSAGGVISCVYTLEHQHELAGLICESFAYKVPAPDIALSILKGVSHIAPHAHVLRLKIDDFSRDPQVIQAMKDDPFVGDEVQPTLTVAAMARADDRLEQEFPLITIPVLILHAPTDKVTLASGSQFFYDTAGSRDKTLKMYDGHAHDLLNDFGKEQVMADIRNWINVRLSAATAAAGASAAQATA